jgi:hypothetical protein
MSSQQIIRVGIQQLTVFFVQVAMRHGNPLSGEFDFAAPVQADSGSRIPQGRLNLGDMMDIVIPEDQVKRHGNTKVDQIGFDQITAMNQDFGPFGTKNLNG